MKSWFTTNFQLYEVNEDFNVDVDTVQNDKKKLKAAPLKVRRSAAEEEFSYKEFYYKYRCMGLSLLFGITLALLLSFAFSRLITVKVEPIEYSCALDPSKRIPCINGGINSTSGQCQADGCCWDGKAVTVNGSTAPFCFHSYPAQYDYIVTSIVDSQNLTFYMKPWHSDLKSFGESSHNLKMSVDHVSESYVRIRAVIDGDENVDSPFQLWPDLPNKQIATESQMLYGLINTAQVGDRFTLSVFRKTDNVSLITFDGGPLTITDNYTEYAFYVPSTNIYGLGEQSHESIKHSMNFEQWQFLSRSQLQSSSDRHYFGVQPFYMCIEKSGNVHGVLLGLSQPALISLQPGPSISIKTSGQLLEVHVFVGPTPANVMSQYTEVIGRPLLPPYWSLGYHTCRSFGNTSFATQVINAFSDSGIPHESDCGDATLLQSLSIPGPSSSVYENFASVSQILHQTNRKLILFQGPTANNASLASDPGIYIRNTSYSLYIGNANGRAVLYPDFHNQSTTSWLTQQYSALKQQMDNNGILFDGVFLIDNTPLDQLSKAISPCQMNVSIPPISDYMMNYYFLDNDTVCLTALSSDSQTPHSNWHNMYGRDHLQSVVTSLTDASLLDVNKGDRMMIASLSTFPGSGLMSGHWGGDFECSWSELNASLLQTLEYSLYGIPFTGNPVCGYRGSLKDENLCWKWMQMASMFPLLFTYYDGGQDPREPVMLNEAFQTMSKDVISLRYLLLPYIYTLFYQASQTGEPIIRPLFYHYPNDNLTYNNAAQFMLGPSLLVSPSLTSQPEFPAYFPAGTWYELQTQRAIGSERGRHYLLLASQHFPNIYIKAGSIIPLQYPGTNTVDSRLNPYMVTVALKPNSTSTVSGFLYIDDGLSSVNNMNVHLYANNTAFWWTVYSSDSPINNININVSNITVTGLQQKPKLESICITQPEKLCNLDTFFDPSVNFLVVNIENSFSTNFTLQWSYNE